MKYAIIAAGEGTRLSSEAVTVPKPLVTVHGETLIDRLIRIFSDNDAEEIVVITRQPLPIRQAGDVPVRQVVKATPSSMHSFHEISPFLSGEPFVMTTVDTVFREEEFREFVNEFKAGLDNGLDGLMGVTDFVDDEKPLYIKVKEDGTILSFLDHDRGHECRYISGGIYGLTPTAIGTLSRCISEGQGRMRNFQRALIQDGHRLRAHRFSKIIDLDHAADIAKAERFLKGRVLGISRAGRFSPNSAEKDRMILHEVMSRLAGRGYETATVDEESLLENGVPEAELYLSMARSEVVISKLVGRNVLNNPEGTAVCSDRRELARKAAELDIRIPEIMEAPSERDICSGVWVKRATGTTTAMGDTVYCASPEAYHNAIESLRSRGVNDVIVERHEAGDLLKFYGVSGTSFFKCIYPAETGHAKFGLESVNGQCRRFPFDAAELERKAKRMAEHIGIRVFGGDAIVREDGSFVMIDFNDWPSFASCRQEAGEAISGIIDL